MQTKHNALPSKHSHRTWPITLFLNPGIYSKCRTVLKQSYRCTGKMLDLCILLRANWFDSTCYINIFFSFFQINWHINKVSLPGVSTPYRFSWKWCLTTSNDIMVRSQRCSIMSALLVHVKVLELLVLLTPTRACSSHLHFLCSQFQGVRGLRVQKVCLKIVLRLRTMLLDCRTLLPHRQRKPNSDTNLY